MRHFITRSSLGTLGNLTLTGEPGTVIQAFVGMNTILPGPLFFAADVAWCHESPGVFCMSAQRRNDIRETTETQRHKERGRVNCLPCVCVPPWFMSNMPLCLCASLWQER